MSGHSECCGGAVLWFCVCAADVSKEMTHVQMA